MRLDLRKRSQSEDYHVLRVMYSPIRNVPPIEDLKLPGIARMFGGEVITSGDEYFVFRFPSGDALKIASDTLMEVMYPHRHGAAYGVFPIKEYSPEVDVEMIE